MAMVNNLRSRLKRYLWRFTGMSATNMQSYLSWYVYLFRVNQEADEWRETARVVRHMLMADVSFRSSTHVWWHPKYLDCQTSKKMA